MYDLEKIRNYFAGDKFASGMGAKIESASPESVVCTLGLTPEHRNAAGGIQGGAIFTLADLTFAVHCNLELANGADVGVTVGQSCSISFLKATRGKRLTARSAKLSSGRHVSVYRIEIGDDEGVAVADMLCNAFTVSSAKK
ncbi:phenylacetic acid degradation protein [Clostridia bacterium]|nr:phenylacetic acid degradation protein [Clostridia bacterium]